jgi:hypothetical protein
MNKEFDIDIEMTANITETVATNIIVAAIERQTGKQVSNIQVKYDGTKFAGFCVLFDPKIKPKQIFKPTKEFIVNNFNDN